MTENEKLITEAREMLKRPDGADLVFADELLVRDIADALEAAERELRPLRNTAKDYDANFPCDGGCSANDGPEETCSRHGRSPRDLWDLLDSARRGAHTLGEIVERQIEDTLRWAGMGDQIGTDDPDQQLAWERCAEMPGRIAHLEAEVAALRTAGDAS